MADKKVCIDKGKNYCVKDTKNSRIGIFLIIGMVIAIYYIYSSTQPCI